MRVEFEIRSKFPSRSVEIGNLNRNVATRSNRLSSFATATEPIEFLELGDWSESPGDSSAVATILVGLPPGRTDSWRRIADFFTIV